VRAVVALPDGAERRVTLIAVVSQQGSPLAGRGGGRPGLPSRVAVGEEWLDVDRVRRRLGALTLTGGGTTVTVEAAGGGGFGDPRERDREQVRRDVRDGLVSAQSAADYGLTEGA
jgi:N-methylhydantoinase B